MRRIIVSAVLIALSAGITNAAWPQPVQQKGSSSGTLSPVQVLKQVDSLIKSGGPSSVDSVLANIDRLIGSTDNAIKKNALVSLKGKIVAKRDAAVLSDMSCIVPDFDFTVVRTEKTSLDWISYFQDPRLSPNYGFTSEESKGTKRFIQEYNAALEKLRTLYETSKPDALYRGYAYKKDFLVKIVPDLKIYVEQPTKDASWDEKTRQKILKIVKEAYSHGSIRSDDAILSKLDNVIPGLVLGDVDKENIVYNRYYLSWGGTKSIAYVRVDYKEWGFSVTEAYADGSWMEFSNEPKTGYSDASLDILKKHGHLSMTPLRVSDWNWFANKMNIGPFDKSTRTTLISPKEAIPVDGTSACVKKP